MIDEKGIKPALKSSEVERQASRSQKKNLADSSSSLPVQSSLFGQISGNVGTSAVISEPVASFSEVPGLGAERKPGRPKGAKNKSTKEWVEYFLNTVKESPLMFLGRLYAQETVALARKMQCKREDALKLQVAAANACLPYVHQKQPIAIETGGDELPTIQIFASPTVYQQINNGSNQIKREIVIDGIASITPEEIPLKNNDLMIEDNTELEE